MGEGRRAGAGGRRRELFVPLSGSALHCEHTAQELRHLALVYNQEHEFMLEPPAEGDVKAHIAKM